MLADWFECVRQFHEKFGQLINDFPTIPDKETKELRGKLILEEAKELREALENDNLVKIADGVADLIYVLLGLCVTYGIDIRPIFTEVHRTNMLKEGGSMREDGKVLKPAGWQGPNIEGILAMQNQGEINNWMMPS